MKKKVGNSMGQEKKYMDEYIKEISEKIDGKRKYYAEISNKIGFSSPSYFTNSFKRNMGMLPSEYIKQHQEENKL